MTRHFRGQTTNTNDHADGPTQRQQMTKLRLQYKLFPFRELMMTTGWCVHMTEKKNKQKNSMAVLYPTSVKTKAKRYKTQKEKGGCTTAADDV